MEKILSTSDYRAALQLFDLAMLQSSLMRSTEAKLSKLLGYEGPYCGCVSDAISEGIPPNQVELVFLRTLKDEDFIVLPGMAPKTKKKRRNN